jgi:hypothetical protein
MATDSAEKKATEGLDAAKKAFESIAGVLSAAVDSKEEDKKEADKKEDVAQQVAPPEVKTGFDSGAQAAVERLRKTSHWILGAFVAVGVLVFGSLPFTDVSGVGAHRGLIFFGLLLAGVGISAAIWAVSRVDEPEDASLGELHADLSGLPADILQKKDDWWRNPAKRALYKLGSELAGVEGLNQIGPMHPEVAAGDAAPDRISALIKSIGKSQDARYGQAEEVALRLLVRDAMQETLIARTTELQAAFDRWAKAAEVTKPPAPNPPPGPGNGDSSGGGGSE